MNQFYILIALSLCMGLNCYGCLSGCSENKCTGGCDKAHGFMNVPNGTYTTPCMNMYQRFDKGLMIYDNTLTAPYLCTGSIGKYTFDLYCINSTHGGIFITDGSMYICSDSIKLVKDGNICVTQSECLANPEYGMYDTCGICYKTVPNCVNGRNYMACYLCKNGFYLFDGYI